MSAIPDQPDSTTCQPQGATRDHLANERTYLAWVRTAITVLGLGFVVGKFGVWLRYMSLASPVPHPPSTGISVPLAIGMICVGALLALIATWRYRQVRQAIESGRPATAGAAVVAVTALVMGFAALMLVTIVRTL